MKTKKLIELLTKADPSGEIECCVGNVDICSAYCEPAYYDGSAQVVIRDEKGNAIGGKYKREGQKIQIFTIPFSELVWDRHEFAIDYSELDEERQKSFKDNHDKIRVAAKNCDYQISLDLFTEWFKEKAILLNSEKDLFKEIAKNFYDENLSPYDKISDDIPIIGESRASRNKIQWDRTLEVSCDENGVKIKKREENEHGTR